MDILDELHNRSIAAGLVPHTTISSKTDYKKIEYRVPCKTSKLKSKPKSNDPIYVAQIKGAKQSFKCKLYNLDKYTHLLHEINEATLQKLLDSKKCKGIEEGCTVGINFEYNKTNYLLCRHLIFFRNLGNDDIDSVWSLIRAEVEYRRKGAE